MNNKLFHTALTGLFLILFLSACKHDPVIVIKSIEEVKNPHQIPLTTNFIHNGEDDHNSEVTFTIWMLKNNHIANWLDEKVNGKELYEPVNILWIDYRSNHVDEAKDKVTRFLKDCGFKQRNWSSTGYFAFVGTKDNLIKVSQCPSDKTWSDGNALQDNNHGRIFIRKSPDGKAFYTLGAFSREKGISHHFISFNAARNALHASGEWSGEELTTDFPNHYPVDDGLPFSTQDHDGVVLFVLYP